MPVAELSRTWLPSADPGPIVGRSSRRASATGGKALHPFSMVPRVPRAGALRTLIQPTRFRKNTTWNQGIHWIQLAGSKQMEKKDIAERWCIVVCINIYNKGNILVLLSRSESDSSYI